jgi:ABC-type Fe3+-hydroxamate transport system substrate-binding protein
MHRILLAVSLGVLVLTASACGERSEPTGASVDAYPLTLTGAEGSPTRLEQKPQRILAVGPEMFVTLRSLGIQASVAAGRGVVPRGPFDLILTWASSEDTLPRSTGDASVYVAADRSLDDVERSIAQIGLLVGKPLAARRIADRIARQRQGVEARLQGAPKVRVFLDTGLFFTVSSRTLAGDMIEEAGGKNVAGATPEPGSFDLDELASLNPQLYLAVDDSGTSLAALRRNPRTRRLAAVRTGRFAIVGAAELEPGPQVGLGVEELARLLHPDAFR